MKEWSKTVPGCRSSSCRSSFISPCIRARSPLIFTWSQRSDIAVPRPKKNRGHPRRVQKVLRIFETEGAGLRQWIHEDDLAAALFGGLQRGEHARVIGARVLPEDEDGVRLIKVGQLHAPLADPDHRGQRHAALVDSWHIFEQSGRLFVPQARAKSW